MKMVDLPIMPTGGAQCLPNRMHEGDAGLDLRSTVSVTLQPFERQTIPCGISLAIPEGFGGFVLPRSGLASRHGISVVNAPGLIDSGYRGEVKVVLHNTDRDEAFRIEPGDRIAQLMIVSLPHADLVEVESLDYTE